MLQGIVGIAPSNMADPKMAEVLKQFASKITTSKVKERRQIMGDLVPCVRMPEFPENSMKGVLKHLLITLGLYQDRKSRRAVEEVVKAMAEVHGEKFIKLLVLPLSDFSNKLKNLMPCVLNSGMCLVTLSWTCLAVRAGYKNKDAMQGDTFVKLIELQGLLVYGALAVQKKNLSVCSFNKLCRIWKEIPGSAEQYAVALTKVEASMYLNVLTSCLMKYLAAKRDQETIKKFKDIFVEQFVKSVIGSRTKPPKHLLINCKDLLRQVTHENFREKVLPAIDRAMLRNPEIILEGVCYTLGSLSIDLSQYAMDVGKHLGTQLHSKEDDVRETAAMGCKNLAKQLSDHAAVQKLSKHFFSVLNGSEGKLTMVSQRMGMLSGVGNLSFSTVSGGNSVHSMSSEVTELFIPILQQEVHEATLVHALTMFSLWCAKFNTEVPVKIIQWFKTGLGLKSSTSAVRNSYIQCMNAAFHGDTLIQGIEVLPLLLQTLEKAAAQPTQVQLVSEALSASCLLIKLSLSDIQAEAKLGPFWSLVLDMDKQLFLNEKFLSTASEDALKHLATLTERLILDHPQKLNEKHSGLFYRGLVYTLTHGSYDLRQHAQNCVKKILSTLGGGKVAISILKQFSEFLQTQRIVDTHKEIVENGETSSEGGKFVCPRILAESLATLAYLPSADTREAEAICLETLIDAHHPCIFNYNNSAWTDIVARLKIDAKDFVVGHQDEILADFRNAKVMSESLSNAVSTVVWVAPYSTLPPLVEHVCKCLSDPSLSTVTHSEYEIMCWPEGELYDKSVIESGGQQEEKVANLRRENKLYSYKDQLAEIELKKELEKKKGKAKAEPKLTKKQQEALQAQLTKETEIRKKCKQMHFEVSNACSLLEALQQGHPTALRLHLPTLLRTIVPLMSSPLAAPCLSKVFVSLKKAAFEGRNDDLYATLTAHCTLRLLEHACELDEDWCQEPIKSQVKRVISHIHLVTVEAKRDSSSSSHGCPFPAPTFAYCFYLLCNVLRGGGETVGGEERVIMQALAVISKHAQLKGKGNEVSEEGPELLPRREMLQLLTQLIGTTTGRIHQMAAKCLLEVASSGSGLEGCAVAEQDEIDVLLGALQSPAAVVRECALQGLLAMVMVLPAMDADYENSMRILRRVWVARFDPEPDNKKLADRLWEEADLELEADLCTMLVNDTIHHVEVIRQSTAEALAAALAENPDYVAVVLQQLLDVYQEKLYQAPPILDNFGRVISEAPPDEWPARCGIAIAIGKMSPHFSQDQIESLFEFFVKKSLGDRSSEVRQKMLEAAVAAVNDHGKVNVSTLLPVFEEFLAQAPDTASFDTIRQGIVILMGSLAKHLDKEDPKVKPIVAKLIETLSTPSQQVQEAVANCLPPLVPAIKSDAPDLVKRLLRLLLESENYGERKGAAYGLAGLVKGLGILALKQLDINTTLQDAITNKKNPRYREGALFAYEMLCTMLGRLFEPYVVHILPHLLLCFGDNNQFVREAADDTAKAVMSKLSAHGVKLVLPSLLTALEEDSWRTKTGSVELLGAMAFCAPKQLSACLPSIVPKLTEVLTDSHMKVQKAGAQALKQIGSVIRNPEIQAIVPELLDALQDPTKKTTPCLQTLLETKFVHFIDAPSLALIMPVVQRAFQDRSTETRKMAAQIIGNMYSLTDQKDLSPYLPTVIPGLKQSLLDPVPEVRTVSSRALGAIIKGMGESGFEDLLPWLMQTLTSEQSSVDRSGAAQGLAEVVGGLGLEKLKKLMPDIIATAERTDIAPHVRDGYIMMYIYLPTVFADEFILFVGPILPSILQALADENEYVRDTALRAGQRIVNMYADTAIELLLPELERGLFDDNWRIRYSSVQLLGDLLYRISGVSGKMSTEGAGEDDNFGTENSQQAIFRTLGEERRNRVLAGLYMGRSDTALMVRQAALHVWKVIVTHTPKTLREILSTLFGLLLGCLASTSYDKRQVAARTLGDIVRKLGEKVLPEIIPILEEGLKSEQSDQRQGVCIGLSEIMSSTSKEHVVVFADSLIPTVRKALCDPLPEVREAAAKTFDNLHANIGPRALDDILPDLLKKLDEDEVSEFALDGLKQVMAVKSRVVLPYLVPQLTSAPINTRALSFLSSVAGEALTRHLSKILPALMSALSEKMGTSEETQELEYCQSVVLSVHDDIGVRTVMDELLSATSNPKPGLRCAAITILHSYCEQTKGDYSEYIPQLFRGIFHLFTDSDQQVLRASWECLNAITKRIGTQKFKTTPDKDRLIAAKEFTYASKQLDATDMLQHIQNVRQALRFAISDFHKEEVPGFCLPKKGIAPILPIFREGMLNGTPDLKESAAIGLGEVIRRTSPDALKPSVVNITGPLIRILGDRFSFNVKVAVLETLGLLLGKCGAMLKPFLPQLQTTFVKALNDPNRSVRLKAATALGKLIVIHTRVDPLFGELHTGIKNADDSSIRDTTLQALRGCLFGAGHKMSDSIRKQITGTLENYLSLNEDTGRMTAAGCLGMMCRNLPEDELSLVLNMHLLDSDPSMDWTIRQGHAVALSISLKEASDKVMNAEFSSRVVKAALAYTTADRIPLCMSGLRSVGYIMKYCLVQGQDIPDELLTALVKSMKHESNDIKQLVAQVVQYVAKSTEKPLNVAVLKKLAVMLVMGTKEKNTAVRSFSESALVALLRLREGDDTFQMCANSLDSAMRDSLNEVNAKVLRKIAAQPDNTEEDIDDTILV